MERSAWTDERIDDLARRMDKGFDRVDADIRDLRRDMQSGLNEIRVELSALRVTMFRFGGAMLAALAAVIATNLISG